VHVSFQGTDRNFRITRKADSASDM
jgi:hypothetical protein